MQEYDFNRPIELDYDKLNEPFYNMLREKEPAENSDVDYPAELNWRKESIYKEYQKYKTMYIRYLVSGLQKMKLDGKVTYINLVGEKTRIIGEIVVVECDSPDELITLPAKLEFHADGSKLLWDLSKFLSKAYGVGLPLAPKIQLELLEKHFVPCDIDSKTEKV